MAHAGNKARFGLVGRLRFLGGVAQGLLAIFQGIDIHMGAGQYKGPTRLWVMLNDPTTAHQPGIPAFGIGKAELGLIMLARAFTHLL